MIPKMLKEMQINDDLQLKAFKSMSFIYIWIIYIDSSFLYFIEFIMLLIAGFCTIQKE